MPGRVEHRSMVGYVAREKILHPWYRFTGYGTGAGRWRRAAARVPRLVLLGERELVTTFLRTLAPHPLLPCFSFTPTTPSPARAPLPTSLPCMTCCRPLKRPQNDSASFPWSGPGVGAFERLTLTAWRALGRLLGSVLAGRGDSPIFLSSAKAGGHRGKDPQRCPASFVGGFSVFAPWLTSRLPKNKRGPCGGR